MIELIPDGEVLRATMHGVPQNTLDDHLVAAIEHALAEAQRQQAVLLHLRSATPHFCGGADPARVRLWLGDRGSEALLRDSSRWAQLFERIEGAPVIVLAELHGNALGAGLGLALACDLRIAAAGARIGVPETRAGLLPAGMTVRRLVELAGTVTAQRLLLGGDLIDGSEAWRLGLVHWLSPDHALQNTASETARRIAKQSRAALLEAKTVLASSRSAGPSDTLDNENVAFSHLLADAEPRRRVSDLLERLAKQQ